MVPFFVKPLIPPRLVKHISEYSLPRRVSTRHCVGMLPLPLVDFSSTCRIWRSFRRRKQLKFNHDSKTVQLNLHAPCGLVEVVVPVEENGIRADVTKPVSFICVPSFKVAQN